MAVFQKLVCFLALLSKFFIYGYQDIIDEMDPFEYSDTYKVITMFESQKIILSKSPYYFYYWDAYCMYFADDGALKYVCESPQLSMSFDGKVLVKEYLDTVNYEWHGKGWDGTNYHEPSVLIYRNFFMGKLRTSALERTQFGKMVAIIDSRYLSDFGAHYVNYFNTDVTTTWWNSILDVKQDPSLMQGSDATIYLRNYAEIVPHVLKAPLFLSMYWGSFLYIGYARRLTMILNIFWPTRRNDRVGRSLFDITLEHNSQLYNIDKTFFDMLAFVHKMTIRHNTKIVDFVDHAFGRLRYLEYLDISHNGLYFIRKEWFEGSKIYTLFNLRVLLIQGNRIVCIPPSTLRLNSKINESLSFIFDCFNFLYQDCRSYRPHTVTLCQNDCQRPIEQLTKKDNEEFSKFVNSDAETLDKENLTCTRARQKESLHNEEIIQVMKKRKKVAVAFSYTILLIAIGVTLGVFILFCILMSLVIVFKEKIKLTAQNVLAKIKPKSPNREYSTEDNVENEL